MSEQVSDNLKIVIADLLLERNEARKEAKDREERVDHQDEEICDYKNCLNDVLHLVREIINNRDQCKPGEPYDISNLDRIESLCKNIIDEGW